MYTKSSKLNTYQIIPNERGEFELIRHNHHTGNKKHYYDLCSDWKTLKSAKKKVKELILKDNK